MLSIPLQFLTLYAALVASYPLPKSVRNAPSKSVGRGYSIAFDRRIPERGIHRRQGGVSGESALGNNGDLLYSVPITLGNTTTAVHLDTGSSDLWVITDRCTGDVCRGADATRYSTSYLNSSNVPVAMYYGDSLTGTNASGVVAFDTVSVAGISIENQPFVAVDQTTNPTVRYDTAGIFGLSFPSGSEAHEALVVAESGQIITTDAFVSRTADYAPTLARIAMTNQLEMPMFSIELQRSTIDIGGGRGILTVGTLPDGVDNSSLTWVPIRLYSPAEGGMRPPAFAPDEVYPFRWEVDIEAVYLDGQVVPASNISANNGVDGSRMSALIDTGNSLLRGPRDVVDTILSSVSASYVSGDYSTPTFPCKVPHTLAFQIGGKMFPIDPLDFIGPANGRYTETEDCVADNVVATDPPSRAALFRWSLGDPFFKSNLVAFHYGNLTHPSVDPPRIGLLSLVPENANSVLEQVVSEAQATGGFENTIDLAPTASAATDADITVSSVETPSVKLTDTLPASPTISPAVAPTEAISSGSAENAAWTLSVSTGWTLAWTFIFGLWLI